MTEQAPEPSDGEQQKANGGTKSRSGTPYPYFGLTTAISIVQAVRRAGGSEAPNSAVMEEMGVKKVADRAWAYGVPAAMYFGLVERIGRGDDGRLKLTELATRIALPATPEEARAAKVAAFREPELYAKLLERFAGHPVPSKEGLRNLLHREFGIVESMAPNAAEAFLESLKEADLVNSQNAITLPGAAPPPEPRGERREQDPPPPAPPGMQTISVPAGFIIYKCKISGGRIIEIPLPPEFTKADASKMHAFLLTQIDDPAEEQP
jgi:hypothetical protein